MSVRRLYCYVQAPKDVWQTILTDASKIPSVSPLASALLQQSSTRTPPEDDPPRIMYANPRSSLSDGYIVMRKR